MKKIPGRLFVVSYLARYANRVVIANDRLVKIDGDEVFFRYGDYRIGVALAE